MSAFILPQSSHALPTNALAAITWLKSLDGIPSDKVATELPKLEKWEDTGFVQVYVLPAGTPNPDVPIHSPQIQIFTWTAEPGSNRPPKRKANNLAEVIKNATWDHTTFGILQTPMPYQFVRIMSVRALSDPVEVEADEARFAKYMLDIEINWTRHPRSGS